MFKKNIFEAQSLLCAIALVLGAMLIFGFIGCDNGTTPGGGGPQKAIFSGGTGSNAYTLEITENTNRAAYAPVTGDNFKLILVISNKYITGTVDVTNNGETFTLNPSNGSPITVTVSGNGIVNITGGTGVQWNDGSVFTAPGSLTSGSGEDGNTGMDWPPDAKRSQVGLGGLNNPGASSIMWSFSTTEHGSVLDISFSSSENANNTILGYLDGKSGWTKTVDNYDPNNVEYSYTDFDQNGNGYNISFIWRKWFDGSTSGQITASHIYGW